MRQERLKRQIELGITPAGTQLAERMWFLPDPTLLAPATRAILGKKMELYAGMVENMDFHVGRLIDHLKKIGEYENTIFVVFGDNGAEGTDLFKMIAGTPGTRDYLFAAINWSQTHPNAWGDPGSYVGYGPMWAQVSMTPFSQYKGWLGEGGIRNALIVSGPAVKRPKGSINHGLMHVADIMPTLLEVAGASYPKTAGRARAAAADGQVLGHGAGGRGGVAAHRRRTTWPGNSSATARCGRATGSCAGRYKPLGKGDWELFDLATDPAERKDLAAEHPDKVKAMVALWDDYVRENNVVLPSRSRVRDAGGPVAAARAGRPGLPAADHKRQFVPPKDMMAEPKP